MNRPALHLATPADAPSLTQRVAELQRQQRALACEAIEQFLDATNALVLQAREIADLGSAAPAGIREQARVMGLKIDGLAETLTGLVERNPEARG